MTRRAVGSYGVIGERFRVPFRNPLDRGGFSAPQPILITPTQERDALPVAVQSLALNRIQIVRFVAWISLD